MKLVTNTTPVIANGMYPPTDELTGAYDWKNANLVEVGTVFKVKAVMMQVVFLENSKYSIPVDVNVFKDFFVEHEVEV